MGARTRDIVQNAVFGVLLLGVVVAAIVADDSGDIFADFGRDGGGDAFEEGQAVTFDAVHGEGSKVKAENIRRA